MFYITWNISVLKGVGWFWLDAEQTEIENPVVGFFPIFLVLKKGDSWHFLQHIFNMTTLFLQAMPGNPGTDNTYDSETDTPFPTYTDASSFSGSEISWFDNRHILTNITICWLPDWFMNG